MKFLTLALGLALIGALMFIGMNSSHPDPTAPPNADKVIVINPIEVPQGREGEALKIWDLYANYFRKQPGYLGTSLHESIDPSAKFSFINVAEWGSATDFMNALQSEELKSLGEGFPEEMPHYPSLYRIIRQ